MPGERSGSILALNPRGAVGSRSVIKIEAGDAATAYKETSQVVTPLFYSSGFARLLLRCNTA